MSLLFSITWMFLVPLLIVLIPVLVGQYLGIYHIKKTEKVPDTPIGAVTGVVFALLAFMLGFTFQIASNRYDKRRALLLEEVTNMRTTYLRAGLVPEPFRSNTRKLLVEYVDLRVAFVKDPSELSFGISRSQQILDSCWKYAEILAAQDRNSDIYSLYTSSVNDLVDDYNQRITMTLEYRIPKPILWTLSIITFLSMLGLGYRVGISGKRRIWLSVLLGVIFAMVMFLILMLDRPETGLIKLNHKPVLKLQQQLQEMQLEHQP